MGGLAAFAAVRGVSAWLAERRRHSVFPASQAQTLLNPLRQRIMPVRKTLERFGLAPGQTVLELGPPLAVGGIAGLISGEGALASPGSGGSGPALRLYAALAGATLGVAGVFFATKVRRARRI